MDPLSVRRNAFTLAVGLLSIVIGSTVLAGWNWGEERLKALLGYAYKVEAFYSVATFIPMALHTAALFFLIAVAFLRSRRNEGSSNEAPEWINPAR